MIKGCLIGPRDNDLIEIEANCTPHLSPIIIMISTKNLVSDESKVPSAWVFQYYLDLPESLTGQNVRIHSYI